MKAEDAQAGSRQRLGRGAFEAAGGFESDQGSGSADGPVKGLTGTDRMPGSPLNVEAVPRTAIRRAPRLGDHTDELLLDLLGINEPELARLHDANIIAGPADL